MMEAYYADRGAYPTTATQLEETGDPVTLTKGTIVAVAVSADGDAFCLRGHNPESVWSAQNPAYYASDDGGLAPVPVGVCGEESLQFTKLVSSSP